MRIVATAARERHADIDYQLVVVQSHERENAIINTLLYFDSGSAIVFCHTREAVKHLAARLGNRGFTVVALSGELSQSERTNALQAMRDGRARVCVATDVAARGIDLPNLDLVIHADLPTNPDTLLHRSGRTGRAGRKGVCVLIVPVRRYAAASRVLEPRQCRGARRARHRPPPRSRRATASRSSRRPPRPPPPEEAEAASSPNLLARVSPGAAGGRLSAPAACHPPRARGHFAPPPHARAAAKRGGLATWREGGSAAGASAAT